MTDTCMYRAHSTDLWKVMLSTDTVTQGICACRSAGGWREGGEEGEVRSRRRRSRSEKENAHIIQPCPWPHLKGRQQCPSSGVAGHVAVQPHADGSEKATPIR